MKPRLTGTLQRRPVDLERCAKTSDQHVHHGPQDASVGGVSATAFVEVSGCAAQRLRLRFRRPTSAFRVDVAAGVETPVSGLVPCPNRGRSVPSSARAKSWHPPNRLQATISLHGLPRSSRRTPLNDSVLNVIRRVGVVSLDNASKSRGGVRDAERAAPVESSCPVWPSTCRLRAGVAARRRTHRPPDARRVRGAPLRHGGRSSGRRARRSIRMRRKGQHDRRRGSLAPTSRDASPTTHAGRR